MPPRSGATEKVSISLRRSDLLALRKRAERLYGGNLSAVIAELAADAALLEGMHQLVRRLGGASLSDADRTSLDAEWARDRAAPKARPRPRRARAAR